MNSAIPKILPVKVLWLVRHFVTLITYYRDLHFGFVCKPRLNMFFTWSHSDLVSSTKFVEFFSCSDIFYGKARSQWINIEEWVFSVLNVCNWRSIQWLMSCITNCGKIHPSSLGFNFNSLKPKFFIKKFTYSASWKSSASF